MNHKQPEEIFTKDKLEEIFPPSRSNDFFEALFGDASEGAYDIHLALRGMRDTNTITFDLQLKQRPGQCLACNLTYGLPEVFSRHPVINIAGAADEIAQQLGRTCKSWKLESTQSVSSAMHVIPLTITLEG